MSKLVGKQLVDFPDKETGQQVKGIKLHFLAADDRVSGEAAMTQFIRADNACYGKAVGMSLGEFNFVYGPRGRIMDIVAGGK